MRFSCDPVPKDDDAGTARAAVAPSTYTISARTATTTTRICGPGDSVAGRAIAAAA